MWHERDGRPVEDWLKRYTIRLSGQSDGDLMVVAAAGEEVVGCGRVFNFHPPLDALANHAPEGWYLGDLLVRPGWRRASVGARLTRLRLDWIGERASEAYYFASSLNRATIALHARFGFIELTRDFWFPGVTFTGEGVLFRAPLPLP
jgi:predicted N-acetyltransferase YhbS